LKWAQELVKQKEAMKEQPKAEEDGSERDRQWEWRPANMVVSQGHHL